MSSQKGARSKLADVLADIKNSRGEDEYDYNNHDTTNPVPSKRRHAVNYVALSGHTPRQSRSSSGGNNSSSLHNNNNTNTNHDSPKTPANLTTTTTPSSTSTIPKNRTLIMNLFDRSINITQFCNDNHRDVPLYPVCRAWIHGYKSDQETPSTTTTTTTTTNPSSPRQPVSNNISTIEKSHEGSPSYDNQTETADDVYNMPTPKSKIEAIKKFKLDTDNEEADLRIPQSVQNFEVPKDLEETIDKSIATMEHRECLDLNKQRWKQIKRDWSGARKINDWRYEESFKILHDSLITAQRGV